MVVDYPGNPNTDTGLFVKIVPEKSKPIPNEPVVQPTSKVSTLPVVQPYSQGNKHTSYPYNSSQWLQNIRNVNETIVTNAQHQKNSSPRDLVNDYYLGYNRDYLLRTATMFSDHLPGTSEPIRLNKVLMPQKKYKDRKSLYLGTKLYDPDESSKKLDDQTRKR